MNVSAEETNDSLYEEEHGWPIDAQGTYFEITNSTYLNVTLASSENVHVYMESVPKIVSYHIEAVGNATSTEISLSGFEPSKTYYRYQDGNLQEDFTTDESGSYSYTQDISTHHHSFILEITSTIYIYSDGTIDPTTAPILKVGDTYTLTGDVSESIYIQKSGITLDGNGYTVLGTLSGYGIYLNGISGVTIKNLDIDGFSFGIYLYYSSSNTITYNTALNNTEGIYLFRSLSNTLAHNNALSNIWRGIFLYYASSSTITNNTASNNRRGILLWQSTGNILAINTVLNNGIGIYILESSNNNIVNNTASSNNGQGIYLRHASGNTITNSTAFSNNYGIYLRDSSNNNITNNTASSNNREGFYLSSSSSNILRNNVITDNTYNFGVYGNFLSHFTQDIDTSNTIDGKPIYYWVNHHNETVPLNAGYIGLVNSDHMIVQDFILTNNYQGILLVNTSDTTIQNMNVSGNYIGIHLFGSGSNMIANNTCDSNNDFGIYLDFSSNSNILTNNTCNSNKQHGIGLDSSSNSNKIENNICSNNGNGIHLYYSSSNTITNNDVLSNSQGIYLDHSSSNTIANNTALNKYDGILLYRSQGNIISENIVTDTYRGIYLSSSWGNIVSRNTVSGNNRGIYSYWGSSSNTISENMVSDNIIGIYLSSSDRNTITENTVSDNIYGIWLASSDSNTIYLNNFINNMLNAYSGNSNNVWNSPKLMTYPYNNSEYKNKLGNYWDDYTDSDADGDGIGDTTYSMDTAENDYYPLMQSFESYLQVLFTKVVMNETTSSTSTLIETLLAKTSILNNVAVSGDLEGTIDFTNFEIVSVQSGSFAGMGFSKGEWQTNLEGTDYEGEWQGIFFLKEIEENEKKIYLKGTVSGEISGIVEGYLTESVNGSDVYDLYRATWTISHISTDIVFAILELNGTVNYQESTEYPSTEIHALQTSVEGITSGYYNGSLTIVLTNVGIEDETNPYYGEGFSIISYVSEFGSGDGWTYDRTLSPDMVELNGFFADPLMGVVSATLDESGSSRILTISIERIDLGLPPAPDLQVEIWGPRRISPGQTVDYIIEVRNDGVKPAEDVIVINKIPWQADYISNTGDGVYREASREVAWNLEDPEAKSKKYLTTKVEVEWGLPVHSVFRNIVIIPKEEIEVVIDPTVEISYEALEANESYVAMNANVSNQFETGLIEMEANIIDVSDIPEPELLDIQYSEDLDEITIMFQFTIEAASFDQISTEYKITKEGINIFRTAKEAHDIYKSEKETEAFLKWLRQKDYIGEYDYNRFSGANKGLSTLKFFSPKLLEKVPILGQAYSFLTGEILKSIDFNSQIGRRALDDAIIIYTEGAKSLDKVYKEYLNGESYDFDDHTNEVIVAHDPNIKYGPEGIISPSQKLDYTVEYENEGEGIAFGVYFTDTLDEDLDDSSLEIGPVIDVKTGLQIAEPGNYNPRTRTITWFVGEVGPGEGGYANFSVNAKSDAPEGTELINYGTVYFPSVPEVTRTNGIVSIVRSNQSPIPEAGGPYEGDEGHPITFDASNSTDPDGDTLQYRWDFDNDNSWDTDWSHNPYAEHTWDDDCEGEVTVEVSDGELTEIDTVTVTVTNVAPIASIDAIHQPKPFFILPYEDLTFHGSFSDPGSGDTHTVKWDFGDDNEIIGTLIPIHAYSEPGEYTVTLTVTDDDSGQGTVTTVITVNNAQEAVGYMSDYILALPDDAYWKNPDQRGNALYEKLMENDDGDSVKQLIDAGEYEDAIDKLNNDIRSKMDSNSRPEDWILNPTAQTQLCRMIDALTGYLGILV